MVKTICMTLALSIASVAGSSSTPSTAYAQGSSDELRKEARRLFSRGLALARANRWADALLAFRRSAELVPRASTSYNIANALYRLNKPVEALAELDLYDAMPTVKNDAAARARGAQLRDLLEEDVAVVSLAVAPAGASVFVDGHLLTELDIDGKVQLNPGMHSVRVTRQGYISYEGELRVARGSRRFRRIELKPAGVVPAPTEALSSSISVQAAPAGQRNPSGDDRDQKRFVKRPGFWILMGAIAAAGIGAGVAVAVVRRNDDGPRCGTTGSCATAQGMALTF